MFNWFKTKFEDLEPAKNVSHLTYVTKDGRTLYDEEEIAEYEEHQRKVKEDVSALLTYITTTENFPTDSETGLAYLPDNCYWNVGELDFVSYRWIREIGIYTNGEKILSMELEFPGTLSDYSAQKQKKLITKKTFDILENRKNKYLSDSLSGSYPPKKMDSSDV